MSIADCNTIHRGLTTDPKKFLEENIVFIPGPDTYSNLSPIRSFDFNYIGDYGGYVGTFSSAGHLNAYYLPWAENSGYYVVVEDNADLMFTAQLSGCAVGYIRASDSSGAVRVSHHNIQNDEGMTDDKAMQNSLSFAESALHRKDYRLDEAHRAYVYGVLINKKWTFFVQKVEQLSSGMFEILEVTEL